MRAIILSISDYPSRSTQHNRQADIVSSNLEAQADREIDLVNYREDTDCSEESKLPKHPSSLNCRSGTLSGKMLLVRIVENDKIKAHLRAG